MNGEGVAGAVMVGASVLFVLMNLVTAYRTHGGAIGQVPVMAPPVFAAVFAAFGLFMIDRSTGWPGWPLWGLGLFWLGFTLAGWYATRYAGELGRRRDDTGDGEA